LSPDGSGAGAPKLTDYAAAPRKAMKPGYSRNLFLQVPVTHFQRVSLWAKFYNPGRTLRHNTNAPGGGSFVAGGRLQRKNVITRYRTIYFLREQMSTTCCCSTLHGQCSDMDYRASEG